MDITATGCRYLFSYVSYGVVSKAMCLISEINFYQNKLNEYSNCKDYKIVLSISIILCRPRGNISSFS
jgi:hypothetical protein